MGQNAEIGSLLRRFESAHTCSVSTLDENSFMHAATVELLVQKAHLEADVALAIAEAIDMSVNNAQLVTIPVFDSRVAALQGDIDTRFTTLKADIDSRFAAFRAEMDSRFTTFRAEMDVRFAALEAKIDTGLEKTKAELVRWVFLVMLGNVALSAGATALLNAIQRVH